LLATTNAKPKKVPLFVKEGLGEIRDLNA
jgi:hypothetical protein